MLANTTTDLKDLFNGKHHGHSKDELFANDNPIILGVNANGMGGGRANAWSSNNELQQLQSWMTFCDVVSVVEGCLNTQQAAEVRHHLTKSQASNVMASTTGAGMISGAAESEVIISASNSVAPNGIIVMQWRSANAIGDTSHGCAGRWLLTPSAR